ncbi:MAG: hypothetical protein HQL99_06195 [Magnetococcales bacterium]|nr:hypothetical protein [Magnetococcales bacterium]
MSLTPPDLTKTLANQIADRLAAVDDLPRLLESMRQLGMFNGQMDLSTHQAQPLPTPAIGEATTRIGIWQPVTEQGQTRYERIETDPFNASRWSAAEHIPPKSAKKRIVYLGESVARGFFFDPHFNPVQVMESLLAAPPGDPGYEIIDLACNGQFMPGLLKLAHEAVALQPDLMILFAGNNWLEPATLWRELAPAMARTLRAGAGVAGINRVIENWLQQRAAAYVQQLSTLAQARQLPILVVIPEFNLADFASDTIIGTPKATGGQGVDPARWQQMLEQTRTAIDQGKWSEGESLARQLIAHDQGTTSAAYALLARCLQEQGHTPKAREALEQARDAMLWCWPLLTPRCPAVVRATILQEIDRVGAPWLSVIDLPSRFATWLEGAIPGRRSFFDYCHLTAEGTAMVASALVAAIRERLEGAQTDWHALMTRAPAPNQGIIRRAHLFAAMHNASWGQSRELVRHHAEQAAQQAAGEAGSPKAESPEAGPVTRLATFMADLACRRLPGALCDLFPEVLQADDLFATFRLADMGARRHDLLAEELTRAFQKNAPQLPDRIQQRLLREHALDASPIDLLDPYYHISTWCQPEGDWWKQSIHFKAYDRESRFLLVIADRSREVRLTLTHRIPPASTPDGALEVRINQTRLLCLPLHTTWTTTIIPIPAHHLRTGRNEITLHWPVIQPVPTAVTPLADRIDAGELPLLLQHWGEINTLLAEPAP